MEEAESRNKTTGRRDDETTDRKTTGRQDNETARQAVSGQSSAVRGPTSDLRPSTSGPKVRSQLSVVSSPLLATVLPFPGDERDLARVAADGTRQDIFSPGDGKQHWVYVGRGGNDMHLAVSALFLALAEALGQQPALRNRLQLHFIGTSYAAAGHGQKSIQPIAEEFGLQNVVIEHTDRIPYSQTLRCLLDADALIVPGSDDPGYTASKIYPYLLAGKPLLAVFHENSSVVSLLQKVGGGVCVTFKTGEPAEEIAKRILESRWLGPKAEKLKTEGRNKTTEHRTTGLQTTDHGPPTSDLRPPAIPLDRAAFEPHTARAQARVLAEFFNQILKRDH